MIPAIRSVFTGLIIAVLFLQGCSGLPRIIFVHDPLSADEHLKLGIIYESEGKTDLALAQYRAAIKKNREHFQSWLRLAELSYRIKDYDEAERALKKSIRLRPENADLYNNLAWVYVETSRRLKKAERLVNKAIELNPQNLPYYQDTLGVILLRQGRLAEAIETLKSSVESIPDSRPALKAEAYRHLASAYRAANDEQASKKAEEMAEQYYALISPARQ